MKGPVQYGLEYNIHFLRLDVCVCVCASMYVCNVYNLYIVCMFICIYVAHVCVCVCVCVCVFVCASKYI